MIEILNGIKETVNFKDNTGLRLYDNDKNEGYPNHWHTPIEIIMPIRNTYTAICNNITFLLKEGDVLIISPGVLHTLPAVPSGERLIFQADFSLLHNIKALKSTLSIISPAIVITKENSPSIHHKIHNIMLTIQNEYFSNETLSEALIYSKLMEIFVIIGREYASKADMLYVKSTKRKEYAKTFLSICNYIDENCTRNLTLDSVASIAGFSKFHFTRLFKQFTGISFYQYLNQKKITIAVNLLIDPDISVTEVALRSGFSNLSSFIRMFKLIKDCTPTEFRKLYNS